MKNQYFGDINDYRKYGIIRALQEGSDLPLAMCWMLTPDDGGADGRKVAYLNDPDRWRGHDPEVFDHLQAALLDDRRSIQVAEDTFFESAVSHSDRIGHRLDERTDYFASLARKLNEPSLVFFDPDNGLEVPSAPIGRRGAEKYLYWDELENVYDQGHSCIVYQHFPRVPRNQFILDLAREVRTRLGIPWVTTIRTPHVLFLVVPQADHERGIREGLQELESGWKDEIFITDHADVVIRPAPANWNISPLMFHRYAQHFLHAAKGFENPDDGFSPVPYFLVSRAIELVLKAFLSARGLERIVLKNEFQHNLHRLLNAARKAGIKEYVELPSDVERLIQQANSFYNVDKGFEYFRLKDVGGGFRDLPDLSSLVVLADLLVDGTEDVVRDAT